MPITFSDFADDSTWRQVDITETDPSFYWASGGFMTDAPVDVAATFAGGVWQSTSVEAAFGWRGRRLRPDFVVPKRHHNLNQLTIVVSGEVSVVGADDKQQIAAGSFWVSKAGEPFTVTAGSQGARILESWSGPMTLLETSWHDDENWVRR